MDTVKGYKIPFYSKPFQSKIPSQPIVGFEQEELVKLKVKEMLKKGTIRKVQPLKGKFVSNVCIPCKKEKWGPKTSDKSEAIECLYHILPLQNGRFAKSAILAAKRRLHVQARLKKRILFSSFGKKFKAICSLPWSENFYELLYLCFGLEPAPRIFTKLLKCK